MIAKRLAAIALAISLAAPAAAQQVQRREIGAQIFENVPEAPQNVKDSLSRYQNARSAYFADWLPDGSMLIRTRFGATNQVHHVAAPGSDRRQVTFYDDPVAGASVVPGKSSFVFSKDTGGDEWFQLFLSDGKSVDRRLTESGTRNLGLVFTPDGKTAIWGISRKGDADTDIVAVDLAAPAARRTIHEGQGSVQPLDVSPDGKTVLLGRYLSITESKRYLLDIATGKLTEVAPGVKTAFDGGRFLPGGKSIVLLSDKDSDNMRLAEVDLATGAQTVLTPDLKWDVETFDLSDDGRILAYSVNEDGYSVVHLRDMRTKRALPQPKLPVAVLGGLKLSRDGSKLAIGLSTPKSAGDVWSWDVTAGKLTRWTTSELGGLDAEALVEPKLVRFNSFDGLSVPAFVYKPKAAGPLPVIIDIHGGPEGQSRPGFNPIHQQMVNELGAAVIVPNVRGSTGYGKTYVQLDNAAKREDSVKDIGALLDWIKTQPDLDSGRVVVYGQSYGGYMVLACMTHYSDRLAGAVDRYGISNWVSFLTNTEAYRRDLRRAEYGDERDPGMRAVFDRISPLNNVAKIAKPMLIMQGLNDPRVPASESRQIVDALRARGIAVGYVQFKDEGHGFLKKPNNDARREAETVFLQDLFRPGRPGTR
jgi:dipeptidyl aminopeptidase/acylaminoacyl peptidase